MEHATIARACGLIAGTCAVLLATAASAQTTFTVPPQAGSDRVRVMVELNDAPAAAVYGYTLQTSRAGSRQAVVQAAVAAARSQITRIRQAQATFASAVSSRGVRPTELFRADKSFNGIAMQVNRGDMQTMRAIAGVRNVHILPDEFPTNSSSVPFLGTPQLWGDTLGIGLNADGAGIRIGIIDTGIDYQHGNFGGTGVLADYQANDRTVAPDAFYPTAKVVGGRDFAGDTYNGSNAPAPDADPMDCNGHGTHVAGSAAGFGVTAAGLPYTGTFGPATPFGGLRIGPGTAPRALLYGLRVFGCGGSTNLTIQAIDWAMDPNGDNDLSDHLDVINMSLGSNFGGATTTTAVAADNAALAGVIVVASAGNAGDTFFISGSPGSGGRVIATAASADSGLAGPAVRVNAPGGIAGFYVAGTAAFGNAPPITGTTGNVVIGLDASDAAGPLTTDGCSPLTNAAAVAGNIALIDRGTCGFSVKVKTAQDAGAIAVVIANSAAGAFGNMGGTDPTITIPSVMATFADGNTFKANIPGLNVTLLPAGDTLASFSSRGPRRIASSAPRLKPDIAAPGLTITSAQTGVTCTGVAPSTGCQLANASGFIAGSTPLVLSGTSMASPHVAGIVALLRQIHPDWAVEDIKALAMNYAVNDVTVFPLGGGSRYGLSRIGAGRVDPPRAAVADVVAYNADDPGAVSITFDADFVGNLTRIRTLRVVNRDTVPATFDLGFDTVVDAPGIAYSLPGGNTVTIPAASTVQLTVQMATTAAQMDHTREASIAATQTAPAPVAALGNLDRHWLTEESAYLTFSQGGTTRLRVPVHTSARPASRMAATDAIATGGAPTGSTTIALSGSDVCTGTLGAGPLCNGTTPNDQISLVTPFELQVQSPLNPAAAPGYADLQYVGVAYNAPNTLINFGVSMWDRWSSTNDVSTSICVDNNEDGIYDRILFNTNPGTLAAQLGANPAPSAQDASITAILNTATSGLSVGGAGLYVNLAGASIYDSALMLNNVLFMGATPAQLGLTAGDTTFRYKVATCFGNSPLCAFSAAGGDRCSGNTLDSAAGPFFWNTAAQGLDFNGLFLQSDLNGATLPVTWNTANMATNGSAGALLLHHHNASGQTAEVVALDTAQRADLAVTAAATPLAPAFGQNTTFTVTITNNGPSAATGVLVNALLPQGLTYVSDTGAGAYSAGLGVWTVGSIAAGATATLNVVASAASTDQQCLVASRGGSTPLDTHPLNDRGEVCVLAPRSSDLQLTMAVSSPTVLVGNPVTYTLTVRNSGTDPAYSLNVNEAFAAFPTLNPTSFVASQGVYNGATGLWNLATLPSGGTATLALTFTAPNTAGALTNTGTGASGNNDPNTANNTASATTTVLSPASVSSTMTVAPATVAPGGTVSYTVVLNNSAAFDQQNNPGNEFVNVLPATLTLVSASASSGTAVATLGSNTVTWNGVVPATGAVTITINATVAASTTPQVVNNQGTVNSDADGNGVNELSALTDDPGVAGASNPTPLTVASPANISSATKTVSGSFVAGGAVTYTVTLGNTGAAAQLDNPGNEFIDVLPAGLTLVSATASSGTAVATVGTNTVAWNGSIAAAGSVTITINATINAGTATQTISNQATVNFDADGNGTNESTRSTDDPGTATAGDPTAFVVLSPATISTASKTVSGAFNVGGAVAYTITLTNSGAAGQLDNPGNEFTDVLPAGLTLVSATASSGTAVATIGTNTVAWNGTVPAASSVTITINATINAGTATQTISNQGTVNFDADGNGSNESTLLTDDPGTATAGDPTAFVVLSPASIGQRSKSVSGMFLPGGQVVYTVVIGNSGNGVQLDNPGPEFVDVLPATLQLLGATASSGTVTSTTAARTVEFNGSIPAAGTVTLTITARIDASAAGLVVSNQGTIHFDGDGNGSNESTALTDDPRQTGTDDPTVFSVGTLIGVPAIDAGGRWLLLVLLTVLGGGAVLRRRD